MYVHGFIIINVTKQIYHIKISSSFSNIEGGELGKKDNMVAEENQQDFSYI